MSTPLAIGSKIWIFDPNRRIYPPAPEGRLWATGGPIYREHWSEAKICGETSRSWIIRNGQLKVSKKGQQGVAFTAAEMEFDVWLHDNRLRLERAIMAALRDPGTLIRIAKEVGVDLSNCPPR